MADMNGSRDIEARLRRFQPAEPPAKVRATVLGKATQLPRTIPRRSLWRYAAAAALVLALNLGTEWWMSSRTQVGSAGSGQATAAPGTPMVLEALNGFATHWGHLAVQWNGHPGAPASRLEQRRGLLKEFNQ